MNLNASLNGMLSDHEESDEFYKLKIDLDLIKFIDNKHSLWIALSEINGQVSLNMTYPHYSSYSNVLVIPDCQE